MVKLNLQETNETTSPIDLFSDDAPKTLGPQTALTAEPRLPEFGSNEMLDPSTGEIISLTDVDAMISCLERVKQVNDQAYACQVQLRNALAGLTEGDAKTRRIRGKTRIAKVEMPSDSYDQKVLKHIWESFPQLREECLKIDTVGVKAREYKKIVGTTGEGEFEAFRDLLSKANRGPTGTPTVTIEQ